MTDRGSFSVQSEALKQAAALWAQCADDVSTVSSDIAPGVGGGGSFGVLAGASGVAGNYNLWSQAMYEALATARDNFTYLEAALISSANDYDGVDSTTATDMDRLDRLGDPEVIWT